MSTDENALDIWLKLKIHRDIIFRSIIWFIISFITGYITIHNSNISAIDYFKKISSTISFLINTIGTFSILISIVALMLKDLEATLSCPRLAAATRGYIGGFIRRIAGDLSLWTIGSFVTILAATMLVILKSDILVDEYTLIGYNTLVLLLFIVFIAVANILVRRRGPTLLPSIISNPLTITLTYLILLALLISCLLFVIL